MCGRQNGEAGVLNPLFLLGGRRSLMSSQWYLRTRGTGQMDPVHHVERNTAMSRRMARRSYREGLLWGLDSANTGASHAIRTNGAARRLVIRLFPSLREHVHAEEKNRSGEELETDGGGGGEEGQLVSRPRCLFHQARRT